MATTLAQLRAAALQSAQGSAADTEAAAIATRAVNEAYLGVCGDGTAWDFLEREGTWALTPGTSTYALTAIASAVGLTGGTIREVIHLVDGTTGGRPIPSMSWEQIESLAGGTAHATADGLSGPPVAWARFSSSLRLHPEPDAAYSLVAHMALAPTALSSDSDAVLLPDSFAMAVLVPYAASILLEADGGPEALQAANRLLSRYEANLVRMRTAHGAGRGPMLNLVAPGTYDALDAAEGPAWWSL